MSRGFHQDSINQSVLKERVRTRQRLVGSVFLLVLSSVILYFSLQSLPGNQAIEVIFTSTMNHTEDNSAVSRRPLVPHSGASTDTSVKSESKSESESEPNKNVDQLKPDKGDSKRLALGLSHHEEMVPEPVPKTGVTKYVLQIGEFTDVIEVKAIRLKLEREKIINFVQIIENKNSLPRHRIRVGPVDSLEAIEKYKKSISSWRLPNAQLKIITYKNESN